MGWAIFGFCLLVVYFLGWCILIAASDDDDLAMRDYEAEREAFEQMFE